MNGAATNRCSPPLPASFSRDRVVRPVAASTSGTAAISPPGEGPPPGNTLAPIWHATLPPGSTPARAGRPSRLRAHAAPRAVHVPAEAGTERRRIAGESDVLRRFARDLEGAPPPATRSPRRRRARSAGGARRVNLLVSKRHGPASSTPSQRSDRRPDPPRHGETRSSSEDRRNGAATNRRPSRVSRFVPSRCRGAAPGGARDAVDRAVPRLVARSAAFTGSSRDGTTTLQGFAGLS